MLSTDPNAPIAASGVIEVNDIDVAGRIKRTTTTYRLQNPLGAGTPRFVGQHVVCRVHDEFGRLSSVTSDLPLPDGDPCASPSGLSQEEVYSYDAAQRLTGHDVYEGGVHVAAFTFIHDPASRLVERHEGIGNTWLRYGLLDDGRLENLERESPSPPYLPRIDREELEFDDFARPWHVKRYRAGGGPPGPVEFPHWTSYQHDELSRLTRWTTSVGLTPHWLSPNPLPQRDLKYTYSDTDDWNLAARTDLVGGGAVTWSHDASDRIVGATYVPPDTRRNFAGDAGSAPTFTWDLRDRLVGEQSGAVTVQQSYDHAGRLMAQRVNGGPVVMHLWDGWKQLGEYEVGEGNRAAAYSGGPTGWSGERHDASFQVKTHDHQGNVQGSSGLGPELDAFGAPFGTQPSTLSFQGQEWRSELGLYYMRHRWYDPERARFLSRDPVLAPEVQYYNFALGSPVMLSDPMGLFPYSDSNMPTWEGGPGGGAGGGGADAQGLLNVTMLTEWASGGPLGFGPSITFGGPRQPALPIGCRIGAGIGASGNWKSVRQFGHTFSEHGSGPTNLSRLLDRARGTGNSRGQCLDNEGAADFLSTLKLDGPATVRIPQGLGQVIRPDGSIAPAVWARVVPWADGLRTAFPVTP